MAWGVVTVPLEGLAGEFVVSVHPTRAAASSSGGGSGRGWARAVLARDYSTGQAMRVVSLLRKVPTDPPTAGTPSKSPSAVASRVTVVSRNR